jgi:hypothetical protein
MSLLFLLATCHNNNNNNNNNNVSNGYTLCLEIRKAAGICVPMQRGWNFFKFHIQADFYDMIVLNARATTDDKIGESKDCYCEELQQAFSQFSKYHKDILLGVFS